MASSEPPCSRCGLRPVHKAGLCTACYGYRARTGRDRPAELIGKALARQDQQPATVAVESPRERLRRREAEAYRDRAERLRRRVGGPRTGADDA